MGGVLIKDVTEPASTVGIRSLGLVWKTHVRVIPPEGKGGSLLIYILMVAIV